MIRRTLLAATVAIALAPQMYAGAWLKTVAAAQKVAKEKNQLILVDMFAEWCGWCHRFEREVYPSKDFQDATSDIVLLRLDTEDGKEGTQFARKYGINSLPTFLLLAPDLTTAGLIRGYAPPAEFAKMLKETRSRHTAFLQRVKDEPKNQKNYAERLALATDFNARNAFADGEVRLKKLMTEKGVPPAIRDQAHYELAVSYMMQKRLLDAQKTVRELVARSKSGEPVERGYLLLGQTYLNQGNLKAARDEFLAFKKRFPSSKLIANIDMVLPQLEQQLSGK